MKWRLQAKCRGDDPEKYCVKNLTPGRERLEAQVLCAGCTVIPECAEDALRQVNVTRMLRRHFGIAWDEGDDVVPQLGMVRAGELM